MRVALSGFPLTLVARNPPSWLTHSVRERSWEIEIMRAAGFTPAQVVASVVSGAPVVTRARVARRSIEGRSKCEIIRSLKRYIASQRYRCLPRPGPLDDR